MNAVSNGVAFGKLAARVTAFALMLYVVSLVYLSGEELAAIALGGVVSLYAVMLIYREVQYGYSPWNPIEWTTVPPRELDARERRRALRWTITLKLFLVIGAVSGLTIVFAAGLKTLGYVLLVGGIPALFVEIYKHYSNDTRPWYPSVPLRSDQLKSKH